VLDMHMAPMCPVSPRDGLIIRTLLACVTTCPLASPHQNDIGGPHSGKGGGGGGGAQPCEARINGHAFTNCEQSSAL